MRHVDIFGRIQAVEIHELDAGAEVDVQFGVLDTVSGRYSVGVRCELIRITEELVEGRIFLVSAVKVIGVVDGGALVVTIVVGQQQIGMFADRLGIVEGRADRIRMERVVIVLIDILIGIQFVKGVVGSIITVAVVDVSGPGEVEGQGAVGLFELMAEGKVRAVDIEARVFTGRMSYGTTDGGVVLIDGIGDRRGIGGSGLDGHVWPEDKGVVAIDLAFEVEIDALVIGPGDGR